MASLGDLLPALPFPPHPTWTPSPEPSFSRTKQLKQTLSRCSRKGVHYCRVNKPVLPQLTPLTCHSAARRQAEPLGMRAGLGHCRGSAFHWGATSPPPPPTKAQNKGAHSNPALEGVNYSTSGKTSLKPERNKGSQGHLGTVKLGLRASAGRYPCSRPTGRRHLEPHGQNPKSSKAGQRLGWPRSLQVWRLCQPGAHSSSHLTALAPLDPSRSPQTQNPASRPGPKGRSSTPSVCKISPALLVGILFSRHPSLWEFALYQVA